MASVASYDDFLRKLKHLYATKKFSDVQITITESDEALKTFVDVHSLDISDKVMDMHETDEVLKYPEGSVEVLKVINVHGFVLEMSSTYFKNLLKGHDKGNAKIDLKLKTGQTKSMELLLKGFYDKESLKNLDIKELFSVLELAITYSNDEFIRYIIELSEYKIVDYSTNRLALVKLNEFEHDHHLHLTLTKKMKEKCIEKLADACNPIEEKHKGSKFLEFEYAVLYYMLQSDAVYSISENSLLYFIIAWLEYDLTRQTATIIKSILEHLRVPFLSVDYLFCTITIDHHILNKWDGFRDWFLTCLGYKALSTPLRKILYPDIGRQVSRNIGIHSRYHNLFNHLDAVRWLVEMTPEIPGVKFGPNEDRFIHDGLNILAVSIDVSLSDEDTSKHNMKLSIKCFGVVADIRFVVGIVPADITYDISKIHFGSQFSQNFLKWSDPYTFNNDVHVLDFWTADEDFIDHANKHGLYVCCLPVMSAEIKEMQKNCLQCAVHKVTHASVVAPATTLVNSTIHSVPKGKPALFGVKPSDSSAAVNPGSDFGSSAAVKPESYFGFVSSAAVAACTLHFGSSTTVNPGSFLDFGSSETVTKFQLPLGSSAKKAKIDPASSFGSSPKKAKIDPASSLGPYTTVKPASSFGSSAKKAKIGPASSLGPYTTVKPASSFGSSISVSPTASSIGFGSSATVTTSAPLFGLCEHYACCISRKIHLTKQTIYNL